MKNRLALLVTLGALVAPFAEAGEVKGRILLGDKPASGVTVSALPHETAFDEGKREAKRGEAPKPLAQVTTGAGGSFVLTVPPAPGKPDPLFQVRIEGGGVTATIFDGLFDASESEDLGDLSLSKGEKLAGKVVGEAGVPIEGAVVTLVAGRDRNDDGTDLRRAPRKATTGADGTFRFDDAFASQNTLTVEKDGYAVSRLTSVRSGAVTKPIALAKGAGLAGSVRRADRKGPAANALVRFEGKATTRWVVTAEDGTFRIPNAPDGKGTVVVDAGDAGTAELPNVTVPQPGERKLVATLRPPAVLEGRVLDAKSGKALPRVKIQLKGNGTRLARSGPDGKYRISPIAPPISSLRADEPRYVPYTKELSIAAGETRKLDLPLTLGATLTGRVVDETAAPVGGAKGQLVKTGEGGVAAIFLRLRGGSGPVDFKSLPDGSFKATRLAPGESQRLSVKHPDFETATVGGVSLQPGATKANVLVTLKRGASVVGVVKDANGNPIANADVSVTAAVSFRGGRGGINISMLGGADSRPATKSGADGTFVVRGLAPGDYTVTVRLRGYAGETVDPVKVTEDGAKEPLAITLQPGASIHGIVKSKGGAPMEGYVVNASAAGRGPRRLGPMEATGPDGLFSVEDLKAGETYDVQIFGGTGAGPQKKVTAPADGVELVVTGNGKIAGTAVDAQSGRPLTDYTVSYEPNQSGPGGGMVFRMASRSGQRMGGIGQRTEVHADDGAFVLEEVPAGKWQVAVEAKGYQTARVGGVTVEEGQTAANVEVKVPRGATLKGHVTDGRSRRSLPDVSVTSESAGGGGPGGMMAMLAGMGGEGSLNTDADGRFEQEGLAPGKYKITARHPDYAEATETVELKENGTSVEIQLTTGGALGGTVFSDNRQPLAGVDVSLAAAGEGGFGRMVGLGGGQQTTTDSSGRFRFDHLTAGRFTVSATLRSKSATPVDVVLQAGESKEDVALTLAAGATIRGLVSGLPEAQRTGVNVTGMGPDSFFASTRTGADGRFELTGVPTGAISLRAQAGDFMSGSRTATKQVPVADGQAVVDAEIVFENGFTLSGRVVRSGQGVAGANVNAFQQGGGSSANVRADDSGNYRLEGLLEGTYTVSASSRDFSGSSRSETVKLAGDQSLDITFPSARIAGTVVEAGSRSPLADAVIEVASDDSGPRFFRSYRTDSNGRFALEDIDPKPMTLTVRRPDYLFEKRTVTPAEGSGSGNDLTIELTRGEGIGIEVRDGLYRVPLRGALARVLDAQKTPVFTGSVSLDTEGRGDIPSLKPGRYTVQVDASGYAPATIDGVNVPSSRLAISLTPGGTVEIHSGPQTLAGGTTKAQILGSNGQPYAFNLFGADGSVILSNPVRRLENFAPGTYAIAVTGGATKSFNVTEGGTTIVTLP